MNQCRGAYAAEHHHQPWKHPRVLTSLICEKVTQGKSLEISYMHTATCISYLFNMFISLYSNITLCCRKVKASFSKSQELKHVENDYVKNLQQQVYFLELEANYLREQAKKATEMHPQMTAEAERMLTKLRVCLHRLRIILSAIEYFTKLWVLLNSVCI